MDGSLLCPENCKCLNRLVSEEMSFYFAVSDIKLAELDPYPPQCEEKILCKDKKVCGKNKQKVEECAKHSWHSEIYVSDNLTGLREIEVTSPGSRLIKKSVGQKSSSLVIGSSRTTYVLIETECCYDGVELSVRDVAENLRKCVAGINPNVANQLNFNYLFVNILLILNYLNR